MKLSKYFTYIESKNAFWIITGKLIQSIMAGIVGILSARYLGPSNYGLINYVSSLIAFFTAFCTLGINGLLVNVFLEKPDEVGLAIGSTLVMRLISSLLSGITVVVLISIIDRNEPILLSIACICSFSLIFQISDTLNYWFQSKYLSKYSSIASLLGYFVVSVYKIVLLICHKSVFWFAAATSIEYCVVAVALLTSYKRCNGPRFVFSIAKCKSILSRSYHFILASMMVAIYGQTDKFMLKHMLGEKEVGYYSIATSVCAMWTFVLSAIIDSVYPSIVNLKNQGQDHEYKRKNKYLYCITFYIAIAVSISFQFLGGFFVSILYGEQYSPSIPILKTVTWYTAFSYLGVARGAWLVCENKQKYLKYMYICAAFLNVILNFIFIPYKGATGAALASLLTQIFTSIIIPLFIPAMRESALLIIKGILFIKDV